MIREILQNLQKIEMEINLDGISSGWFQQAVYENEDLVQHSEEMNKHSQLKQPT